MWVVVPCRNVLIGEYGVVCVTRGDVGAVITLKSIRDRLAFGRVPGMIFVPVIL